MFGDGALQALPAMGEADLRLLHSFMAVVAAGGFSAAAAGLQVDLSTISKQIAELEARLGLRLAQRGRAGFRLTADGERLHTLAARLFGAIRSFDAGVVALGQPPPPLLRLGVVDALMSLGTLAGNSLLADLLARCVRALPGLQLHISAMRPLQVERDILAGQLDAGIIGARAAAPGLQQLPLCSEPNSLWVAPGHPWYDRAEAPRSPQALAALAHVADPYGDELPEPLRSAWRQALPAAHADSLEGVALLVLTGCCAGVLPDHLVQQSQALRALRPVWPQRLSFRQDIVLTCRAGKVSAAVRQLLRQLGAVRGGQA
jgi:DNA-binding transcriptional LysR family regulator